MQSYAFTAVAPDGRRIRERADARDIAALRGELEGKGLIVLNVSASSRWVFDRPRADDALVFLRGLHSLCRAGLPLSEALGMCRDIVPARFQTIATEVRTSVNRGDTLSRALAAHVNAFSPVTLAIVAAGEQSGRLPQALGSAISHLERERAFRTRVLSASVYPAILGMAGTGTLLVMLVFVLPRFAELISAGGGEIPRLAAILLGSYGFVRLHILPFVLTALVGAVVLTSILRSSRGRVFAATFMYRVSVIGPIRRSIVGARFSRSLAMLIDGGVPIVAALAGSAACMRDPVSRAAVVKVETGVRGGMAVRQALRAMWFLPAAAHQLIAIGERSGDLAAHLVMTADILERDADVRMDRLMVMAEPAMIVVFGGAIGTVALALLQAVYGMQGGVFR